MSENGKGEVAAIRACSEAAWEFSQAPRFWARFCPLSPYGKDERDARRVLSDRAAIEALYDGTEAALDLLERLGADPSTLDRISYHLKRVPRISLEPVEEGQSYDLIELFQVKKFIANYRRVGQLAGPEARDYFDLAFASQDLAEALDLGGSDSESFYVSDAYDPRLKEVRSRIAIHDAVAAADRAEALGRAEREYGLSFEGREFALVSRATGWRLLQDRSAFAVEPYDDGRLVVRLQPGERELEAAAERDSAAEEEKRLEGEVLKRLSALVSAELPRLESYIASLTAFDLALARASLVRDYGLSRPMLADIPAGSPPSPLRLERGVYLPCAWDCEALGLEYSPLNLAISQSSTVVFGSNMGGKTVALETIVFFQVLAQAGFFVPATSYATQVYPLIHYVGEGKERASAGLSGFGFEIRSFVEAWEGSRSGAFVVFDEFARTTSSREAEAILSAVVESLAARPGTRSFFSTHFRGVARLDGVRYLRVKGLDREAAQSAICADAGETADEPLRERIKRINGMMRYGLQDDAELGLSGSDAVAIASLLGLDGAIVCRAEAFYAARGPNDSNDDSL